MELNNSDQWKFVAVKNSKVTIPEKLNEKMSPYYSFGVFQVSGRRGSSICLEAVPKYTL